MLILSNSSFQTGKRNETPIHGWVGNWPPERRSRSGHRRDDKARVAAAVADATG